MRRVRNGCKIKSRLHHGGVDRNWESFCFPLNFETVASITEAWIETIMRYRRILESAVASITEAWIETMERYEWVNRCGGRLHHGGVDRN